MHLQIEKIWPRFPTFSLRSFLPRRLLALKLWVAALWLAAATLNTAGRAQDRRGRSEQETRYYQKWLNEDVLYIISPEEQKVFEELTTPREKYHFIEQFWRRRDNDPRTAFNEFKEEHYRRIAYTNERFSSGKRGWKTDRGRVYIIHGPPDETTYHQGGSYVTSVPEGGNTITAWPFESWRYRYLPDIGQNVELEFVDKSGTGEFTLAVNQYEKYNMAHLHGQGRAATDLFGKMLEQGRWDTRRLELRSPGPHVQAKAFDRILDQFEVLRPPQLHFTDLVGAVDTRIHYSEIPFQVSSHWFLVTAGRFLAAVTLSIGHDQLEFQGEGKGHESANVQLYGRAVDLTGKVAYQFEDLLTAVRPSGTTGTGRMLFQRYVPLTQGRFKLQLIAKDTHSGKLGSAEKLLLLPEVPENVLTLSPVVLADLIRRSEPEEFPPDPFVTMNRLKIYPNVDHVVSRDRALGVYFEIYNSSRDASDEQPDLDLRFRIERRGERVSAPFHTMPLESLSVLGDRLICVRAIRVRVLPPDRYVLTVEVRDRISGQEAVAKGRFALRGDPSPGSGP